jgi:hypothetical protein
MCVLVVTDVGWRFDRVILCFVFFGREEKRHTGTLVIYHGQRISLPGSWGTSGEPCFLCVS